MGMTLKWNKPLGKVVEDATGGDATALFMANEAQRLMDPYVPMETGMLADNVDTYVERGAGKVHYRSPYAHYQYNGEGFNFSHEKHPKATAKWDAAMKSERGKDLVAAVQNFVKGRK